MTMADSTLAPWAELVPDAPPGMTAGDLLCVAAANERSTYAYRFELVAGRLVRMSAAGAEHGSIGFELGLALGVFVKEHSLGRVFAAETGFLLSAVGDVDTVLAPEVAFVRQERLIGITPAERKRYLRLAPDLVAEVASPSQYRPELAAKARHWLAAGVRLVWVIWPGSASVDVWRPNTADEPDRGSEPVATLTRADALDGLDAVPGFAFPVADLFTWV